MNCAMLNCPGNATGIVSAATPAKHVAAKKMCRATVAGERRPLQIWRCLEAILLKNIKDKMDEAIAAAELYFKPIICISNCISNPKSSFTDSAANKSLIYL